MTRWGGPEGSDRWRRDAAILLASEHLERRDPDPSDQMQVTPRGTLVRLVGLLVNGEARVIEMPGYTEEEAFVVARTWANYPEVIDEAAGLSGS